MTPNAAFLIAKYIGLPVVAVLVLWYLVERYRAYRKKAELYEGIAEAYDHKKAEAERLAAPMRDDAAIFSSLRNKSRK